MAHVWVLSVGLGVRLALCQGLEVLFLEVKTMAFSAIRLLQLLTNSQRLLFCTAIGFNVETVQYNNIKFQVWDLGTVHYISFCTILPRVMKWYGLAAPRSRRLWLIGLP